MPVIRFDRREKAVEIDRDIPEQDGADPPERSARRLSGLEERCLTCVITAARRGDARALQWLKRRGVTLDDIR